MVFIKKIKGRNILVLCFIMGLILPQSVYAQSVGDSIYSLHYVLENLFNEMLPLSSRLIGVGRAIAGFAALWYIAVRVWGHIARAEPIDFYPLLRPFAIGLALILFPALLHLMNGVLKPVETATAAMAKDSQKAIRYYLQEKKQKITKTPDLTQTPASDPGDYSQYEGHEQAGKNSGLLSRAASFFSIKSRIKQFISEFFQVLYIAAGLCIDAIRTFYLLILAIVGPLVLGLSVFDGFGHTLSTWLARYIHVYMWLPVANIFGAVSSKILENMMTTDQDIFSTTAYIVFMIICIVGYTTVPSVAGYIVNASGKDSLLHKATNMMGGGAAKAAGSIIK